MTIQEEQSFLTVIVANPDDDTPRLVFADWLDERGTDDDRARAALNPRAVPARIPPDRPRAPQARR